MGTRYASALGRELAREIAALGAGEVLTIAEAGSAGIVIWDVHRDQNGTLQSQVWPIVRWSELADRGAASDVELRRVIPVGPAARLLFVRARWKTRATPGPSAGCATSTPRHPSSTTRPRWMRYCAL